MNTPTRDDAVVLENVVKRYTPSSPPAVDQVSLHLASGQLTTLLGPSGCGKTTTLRLIAGLEMSTSGRILIGNQDVTHLPATQRDVSMVFQSYALFPHMRVSENIRYGLEVGDLSPARMNEKVDRVLELLGLSALRSRFPHELSGGQQQRVAVARALVLEPQVLLFDEPLSNLDAKLRRQVRQEIRELQQSLKLTVIYVTHDQEEALAISDTIVVLNNAVVAQIGSPRVLYEKPQTRFVADFMGEANILACGVAPHGNGLAEVRLADLRLLVQGDCKVARSGHLAIQPSKVQIRPAQDGQASTCLPGTLRKVSYLGDHMEYTVQTAVGELLVRDNRTQSAFATASAVELLLPEEATVLLQD